MAAATSVVRVTICRLCGGHLTGQKEMLMLNGFDRAQLLKGGLSGNLWFVDSEETQLYDSFQRFIVDLDVLINFAELVYSELIC